MLLACIIIWLVVSVMTELKIMLIFFIISNRKADPPNFAQNQSYISRLYFLLRSRNLLEETPGNHLK